MLLGNGKARNVTVIIWIEELAKLHKTYWDFVAFLQGLNIQAAISPVHDMDTYTAEDVRKWVKRKEKELGTDKLYDAETGELLPIWADVVPQVGDKKKAHVHVVLKFAGVRTGQYLSELFAEFGLEVGLWRWQKVESLDALIRYLAHMDDPEKWQYSPMTVIGCGGIDLSALVRQDSDSRIKTLMAVQNYIDEEKIRSYHVLCRWAFGTGSSDIVSCVCGRASHFQGYFRSIHDEEAARKAEEKKAENMTAQ